MKQVELFQGGDVVPPEEPRWDHESEAFLSEDRKHRFMLWRARRLPGPTILWVMLNPSTADESQDDPTVRKVIGFSRRMGGSAACVVNLFTIRATDPKELQTSTCLNHARADWWIDAACRHSGDISRVVYAWGSSFKDWRPRALEIDEIIRDHRLVPHALRLNGDGAPSHPGRLPYASELIQLPHGFIS